MKRTIRMMLALATFMAAGQLLAQTPRTAEVQFKAAQHMEEVEGDLKGAIAAYQKIAQGKDRSLAVQALLRMAGCYEKLGDAEAQKIYGRVVRDFADQTENAALARTRLAAALQPARDSQTTRRVWTGDWTSVSLDGRYLSYTDWETGDVA